MLLSHHPITRSTWLNLSKTDKYKICGGPKALPVLEILPWTQLIPLNNHMLKLYLNPTIEMGILTCQDNPTYYHAKPGPSYWSEESRELNPLTGEVIYKEGGDRGIQ